MRQVIFMYLILKTNLLLAQSYYPNDDYYREQECYFGDCTTQRHYSENHQQENKALEHQYANLIIMFTKENCGFCRYMYPIMKEVEKKFGKDIKFLYIDVEEYPESARLYNFKTVPQIAYFKNGKKLAMHGSDDKTMTAAKVEEKINALGLRKNETHHLDERDQ